MAIVIRPYTNEAVPEVREFNGRLAEGGVREFQFPETPVPDWLPQIDGRRIFQQFFLAHEDSAVRGGYILKHQEFSFSGDIRPVGYYHRPLSEGLVDRRYSAVGVQMLRNALKCQPLLYCLGMGGEDRPLPQMLKAMGWPIWPVPFHFKVLAPGRFLREMRALRTGPASNLLLDLAARSGAGWAAVRVAHWLRRARPHATRGVTVEEFRGFGAWADDLWQRCKAAYSMIAVRDTRTLNILYPANNERFLCLRVLASGEPIGWVVALDTRMQDDTYFGNLRVGSIADCLAHPNDAPAVAAAAAQALRERGVELIVSNQAHGAWSRALAGAGFLNGPSNFMFAASPKLAELIQPLVEKRGQIHMTRGDGDGPIHL